MSSSCLARQVECNIPRVESALQAAGGIGAAGKAKPIDSSPGLVVLVAKGSGRRR